MKYIPKGLALTISRQLLTMKKHSPRILFVAGIAGTIGSTVLACRATLKLDEKLDEFRNEVDAVQAKGTEADLEYRKDMARAYIKGSASLVRLYAPAVIVGGVSIAALTGSHITLTNRNANLSAAYSAVAASYASYRDRVREQLGEEKELDIYHSASIEKSKSDGKTVQHRLVDPNSWSPYARMFDEYNKNWRKDADANKIFLTAKQNYLNHLLGARGHVFLNEAYDELGFERTKAGQVVGWVRGNGDNFIDFGMYEARNAAFAGGWERSIVLDFNVDGEVLDLIGT